MHHKIEKVQQKAIPRFCHFISPIMFAWKQKNCFPVVSPVNILSQFLEFVNSRMECANGILIHTPKQEDLCITSMGKFLLDKTESLCYNCNVAGVSEWQTRQTQNLLRKRVGSSPTTPTIIYAISSVGKSIGFLIRRSKVRVLYGVPLHSGSLKVKRATYNRLMYGSSPTQSTNMAGWQSPVYCTSLENWQPSEMAVRGFKSHPCRH